MAQIIMSDCKLWAGGYDASGKLNAIALDDTPDILENTTFGATAKSRKHGLPVITATLAGFFEAPEPDAYFSTLGTTNTPMTVAPASTLGGPAYTFLSQNIEYSWGGSVGELAKFTVKAESVGTKMVRGNILENGSTARTSSSTGSIFQFTGVSAVQYLYGTIHFVAVAAVAGDTITVIIESDPLITFLAPTTRMTFTQKLGNAGVGAQWATPILGDGVGGAITDTFWRAKWTIGGGSPSFTFACIMGIM